MSNGLNRLGTLTYAPPFCTDPYQLRSDVASFFRTLRTLLGGERLPYVWVPEFHKDGVRFHVHFAIGRFVKRSLIVQAWPHGFVHIKLLGDLSVGSGPVDEARAAAGYLSKYVTKMFGGPRIPGLHRYDVAQGFQPIRMQVWGRSSRDVLIQASELLGRRGPERAWFSDQEEDWKGPPAVWAQWS